MLETGFWKQQGIQTQDVESSVTEDALSLMQRDDAPDLYGMSTLGEDLAALKDAGLLADLSGSEAIRALTSRLRSDMQALVMGQNGEILAFADYSAPLPLYVSPEAWEAAGLGAQDVPGSFTELMDFLEAWAERSPETPDPKVCAADLSMWGIGYVHWLMDLLVSTWELQAYHAGEALTFDTPAFVALAERAREVGNALDAAEKGQKKRKGMLALFENYRGGEQSYDLAHTIPFRITRDQPMLMRATARVQVVRAGSEWLPECLAFLEDYMARYNSGRSVTTGGRPQVDAYEGTFVYAPMRTFDRYEKPLGQFMKGQLSAQELARILSQPSGGQ